MEEGTEEAGEKVEGWAMVGKADVVEAEAGRAMVVAA